jgi:hypothetical protein
MSEIKLNNKKEIRKQYYLNNRDKIIERNKKYYYDNKDERQRYNAEYWALNGHKYVEKRMKDPDYVSKYNEYNKIYRERNKKVIHKNNFLTSVTLNEIIVYFD